MPGNEGRGYVLRRILRRAVRHGRVLGIRKTFLPSLFPSVEGIFEGTYPELSKRRDVIVNALRDEEERFSRTLDTGTELLEAVMKKSASKTLRWRRGLQALRHLCFPLELTQEMAAEHGFSSTRPASRPDGVSAPACRAARAMAAMATRRSTASWRPSTARRSSWATRNSRSRAPRSWLL